MNHKLVTTFVCSLLLCLTGSLALTARAGAIIDPTFGVNGEAEVAGRLFVVQSDGKIVSVGTQTTGEQSDLAVRRYNANGTPDQNFGNGGVVITDVTTCNDQPTALAAQPDGKIVVVDYLNFCQNRIGFALVRYLPDGTLDPSFGANGRVLITDPRIDGVQNVTIQPDGKIVVVGQGLGTFMIARFTNAGMVDRTFGKQGITTQNYPEGCQYCPFLAALSAVTHETDGSLLVTGWIASSARSYFVIGRVNGRGWIEYLHSSDSNQSDGAPTFRTLTRLENGKILAIGDQVARFTPDGYLDPTFTQNKALMVSRGRSGGNGVVTPDGKILQVGGYYTQETSASYIRLFGENGATIGQINHYGSDSVPPTALVQPDGKLVIVTDKIRRYLSISSLAAKQSDFDGDLISDVGYFRSSSGTWGIKYSTSVDPSGGGQVSFGDSGDFPTPGHYVFNERPSLGNLRATTSSIAVYRPENFTWYISTPPGAVSYPIGSAGDVPVNGDFDGDGLDDLSRFQNGRWQIVRSSDGMQLAVDWGMVGDVPVPGDYDYDGFTDIAVYRPASGMWFVLRSSDHSAQAQQFGAPGDRPVTGDYDGDGRTDFAVFRPANGTWYILNSHDASFRAVQFGIATDRPVPGDYDGDGQTDLAVFRAGTWYILQTGNNSLRVVQWGQAGDVPLSPGFTAE